MANSAGPDLLASSVLIANCAEASLEANWSGSTPFAKAGYIQVQQE